MDQFQPTTRCCLSPSLLMKTHPPQPCVGVILMPKTDVPDVFLLVGRASKTLSQHFSEIWPWDKEKDLDIPATIWLKIIYTFLPDAFVQHNSV